MKEKRRTWLVSFVVLVILLLLLGLFWQLLGRPISGRYNLNLENARMAKCNYSVNSCLLEATSRFSKQDKVCAAWTEINRVQEDTLNIYVYNSARAMVYSHVDAGNGTSNLLTRECKVLEINIPTSSGSSYQTDFVVNGRPFTTARWSVSP